MPEFPDDLSNLKLWLKAEDASAASWPDASGSGHTATKRNGTPAIVANALNGRPGVRFDGTGDYITAGFIGSGFDHAFTLIALVRTTADDGVYFGSTVAPASGDFFAANGPNNSNVGWLGGAGVGNPRQATPFGKTMLHVIRYDGANIKVRNNGQDMEWQSATGSIGLSSAGAAIGSAGYITSSHGWFYTGDLFELMLFDRALGDSEVAMMEDWIHSRWAVPGSSRVLFLMDSLCETHGANVTLPQILTMNNIGGTRILDAAVLGSAGMQMANAESRFGSLIDDNHWSSALTLVIELGINDLYVGTSAAALWTSISDFCAARLLRQPSMKIVLHTPTSNTLGAGSGGQSAFDSRRATFCATARAHYADFAHALADMAADVKIGTPTAGSNALYYVDGVHLTDRGNRAFAAIEANAILSAQSVPSVMVVVDA